MTDPGPGIARQHLPRLSERFYRVEGQRSGGTGLGLAIVHEIVVAHGGAITCRSEPGQGTTFEITLPIAAEGGSASYIFGHAIRGERHA